EIGRRGTIRITSKLTARGKPNVIKRIARESKTRRTSIVIKTIARKLTARETSRKKDCNQKRGDRGDVNNALGKYRGSNVNTTLRRNYTKYHDHPRSMN
uniref:Uncharacterized protein n=1 Tax=Anopheles atroparvus TaxID=41427 RepID=A0AAG5DT50_ANOAO